ncbi:MAG: glutathionylspermidine synthase family protein [Chloroflexi bacterium]|nr:glutathionylspermidine synthase family protein [Chloroflexota bacterium]
MRALLATAQQTPSAQRYRRFVQRAQVSGLLPDHLVRGQPYLALNALVLTAGESRQLQSLTEAFSRALHVAGKCLVADVPELQAMGFPWLAAQLLAAEPPRAPLVGRFDYVRDREGHWWLLEFNADTPSGIREAVAADALAFAAIGQGCARVNQGLGPALGAAFARDLEGLPQGNALGLLTDASALEDLAQMAFTQELLRPILDALEVPIVLGDIDNLRGSARGVSLCGRPLGALYRYYPFEAMLGHRAFAAIYEAMTAGRLRLLNGLYGLLLQHKGLLAWLWEHRDDTRLDSEARAAIQGHLPPTWRMEELPPGTEPAGLVVKQVFGREGEEVYFGRDLSPADWDLVRKNPTYVAQARVDTQDVVALMPAINGCALEAGYPTVGSFAVAGRWAGYYTRFGGPITTARARWMATFLEEAKE